MILFRFNLKGCQEGSLFLVYYFFFKINVV
jgi:hypothetical protein